MSEISAYIGNKDEFPVLRRWHFFNHAGVAPIPRLTADALRKFAIEAESGAYLQTTWYTDVERLREEAAAFINAHRDEIAFVKNTSEGLAIVANGIEWQFGDRVVTTAVEYPANIYPWMELTHSRGVKLIMVPEETDENGRRMVPVDKILAEAANPKTKIVTLSHVEFASGQRHDLARIGKFCRANRKLLCVDGIQSLGVLPVDVQAMNIDYLSADGHKWLLGPEGAGVFYCRRELLEHTRPHTIGWMNVVNAQEFGSYDYTLRADAGRFESGSHNIAGLMGLRESIKLLKSIGPDAIMNRMKLLTDQLIDGLELRGYRIISPRGLGQWSGIVSFVSATHRHEDIVRMLRKDHHIEIALREGRLRASPHFYNTQEQIDRLIDALPAHGSVVT